MAEKIRGSAAGDDITRMARKIVSRHPNAPARTLARRLAQETGGAITLEQARTRVRRVLGVSGVKVRERSTTKHLHRPPRLAGQVLEMPQSQAEPWLPFDLKVVGKVGVLSDIHVPYHDETAFRAAVSHLQVEEIDVLLLNGDWVDFYSISRHEKNPKHRDFCSELKAGRQMLSWLRQEFPGVRIVAKLGNHEERWESWLWAHAPEISDDPIMGLDNWFGMPALDIELVSDKRVILAGSLPILHGHELPYGMTSPVNPARGAFLRTKHTLLMGHLHRTSGHCEPNMWHDEVFCWSAGCLCDLRPAYARLNSWNHGFAVVTVHDGGTFDVQNFRVQDGQVRLS
jgi:predicted phosphodiesterase